MSKNQFIPFATGAGANVVDPITYAAESYIQQGFQAGLVEPYDFNTTIRQTSSVTAMVAQFTADNQSNDVNDDGNLAKLETQFLAALMSALSGQSVIYANDSGTSDALSATPNPALTSYKRGQLVAVQKNASVQANQTTTPTIALSGLAAVQITKASGLPLGIGDLPQGGVFLMLHDGTYFRRVSGLTLSDVLALIASQTRINAPGPITLYVNPTTGSDTSTTGSSSAPFATLQAAYNFLTKSYNAGFTATIILAVPNSYLGVTLANSGIAGTINIQGGPNGSAPASYNITPVALGDGTSSCVVASIQTVNLIGVTLDGSSVTSGAVNLHRVSAGGATTANNVIYKYPGSNTSVQAIVVDPGGTFSFAGPAIMPAGTVGNMISTGGTFGGGPVSGAVITTNNATFTNFINQFGGLANLQNLTFAGTGNTGSRYNVTEGALNPASVALTSIPGSTAGTVTLGAGYVVGDPGPPWTAFNPGVAATSGAIGTTSYVARYQRFGKMVFVQIVVSISSVGSGTGGLAFSLPYAPQTTIGVNGVEVGNTNKTLSVRGVSGAIINAYFYDGSSPLAAGNILAMTIVYEAAN